MFDRLIEPPKLRPKFLEFRLRNTSQIIDAANRSSNTAGNDATITSTKSAPNAQATTRRLLDAAGIGDFIDKKEARNYRAMASMIILVQSPSVSDAGSFRSTSMHSL